MFFVGNSTYLLIDTLSTLKNGESIPHSKGDASFSKLHLPAEVIYQQGFRVHGITPDKSKTVSRSNIRSVGMSHECSPNLQDYRWPCHLPVNAFFPNMTDGTTPIYSNSHCLGLYTLLLAFILRLKTEAFCLTFCNYNTFIWNEG